MSNELHKACELVAREILKAEPDPNGEWVMKDGSWLGGTSPCQPFPKGYLLTGNGMLELMEALDDYMILNRLAGIRALTGLNEKAGKATADTAPEALVLAAARMVESHE